MLCIKNGTIIGPDGREKADLYVENGRIAAVGGTLPYDESWDAEGCLLFPGFIDSHTHLEMDTGSTVPARLPPWRAARRSSWTSPPRTGATRWPRRWRPGIAALTGIAPAIMASTWR